MQPADVVFGQLNMRSRHENCGGSPIASSMRWPHAIAFWGEYSMPMRDSLCWPYGIQVCGSTVVVADSGNNRILLWQLQD
jgi:hypothetical protein